jgi:hypothetical protein
MSEKSITSSVLRYLNRLPDTYARKIHGGAYQAGFLDILCCHRGHCVIIEMKMPGRGPTDLQKSELAKWERAGAVAFVAHSLKEVKEVIPWTKA